MYVCDYVIVISLSLLPRHLCPVLQIMTCFMYDTLYDKGDMFPVCKHNRILIL